MDGYLIIGLGSMGKRRVRCLIALGVAPNHIWGVDIRVDRRQEAHKRYGINVAAEPDNIDFSNIKAVIVSLPPDKHFLGAKIAIDHSKPVFIEASVLMEDVKAIEKYNAGKVFIAPSCTMNFHPLIKEIKKIVQGNVLGKVCNFSYHSGQYLPDWHPWENVKNFYVSNRKTGGAREIVPFELTWITGIFGIPLDIKGYFKKTADVGCDIEDTYVCSLNYQDMVGSMTVDVIARFAVRNLLINFQEGQIHWDWNTKKLELYFAKEKNWEYIVQTETLHELGYNQNINENMYIEEIKSFLKGIDDNSKYINSIEADIKILELLETLEKSCKSDNSNYE